jgi:hypothetical protein
MSIGFLMAGWRRGKAQQDAEECALVIPRPAKRAEKSAFLLANQRNADSSLRSE